MMKKPDIFTNKYVDAQLFAFVWKKDLKITWKNVFKVIISSKVVIFEDVLSNIQVLNSSLVDNIKESVY